MYIKCMYLSTFLYIVLYIIWHFLKYKLVSWENHGKGEELCVVDKLMGWQSYSLLRTNQTQMSGPQQIQLAWIVLLKHLLNLSLRGWINLIVSTEACDMLDHESKDVRALTSFCQHLSDLALWDGWHCCHLFWVALQPHSLEFDDITDNRAFCYSQFSVTWS